MKEYFDSEVKEDCIILTLSDLAIKTPSAELRPALEHCIEKWHQMEQKESDPRLVEIEECYCKYAQLILDHMDEGKDVPQRKSYSLNV